MMLTTLRSGLLAFLAMLGAHRREDRGLDYRQGNLARNVLGGARDGYCGRDRHDGRCDRVTSNMLTSPRRIVVPRVRGSTQIQVN